MDSKNLLLSSCSSEVPVHKDINFLILILELEEMMEPHIVFDPVHDNAKPWQCTQCQKTFKQKCHVRDHIEGSHMVGLSFSCPYCSQEIGSRHRLRTHISNKHNMEHKEKQIKISLIQPNYNT